MSFNRLYVHVVISTKYRKKLLSKAVREDLFKILGAKREEYNIYYIYMNGVEDHIHILMTLSASERLDHTIRKLKGYSSYWLNSNISEFDGLFRWSKGYYADGVSRKNASKVKAYIAHQEEYHARPDYHEKWEEEIAVDE
jgi:REP element-mobilizing transposase RayT